MGYKSTSNSASEPWTWVEDDSADIGLISYKTQSNCFKAFFNTIWNQEWFAGVHIYQIRSDFKERDFNEKEFTPQGKPAELIISEGFK
jgi:hypothetical protein